jgi:starch phosphorylase
MDRHQPEPAAALVAYFSMEIALEPAIPTYAGGLGVLAGDTLLSAADLHVPMVAVTLIHHKGYFDQILDASGCQSEKGEPWHPALHAELLDARTKVLIEGREVKIQAWRYWVTSATGSSVPVILLDADLPENQESDRSLTDSLYGGDDHYRLSQEIVLGIGGVRMLRALGYSGLATFHMNEGHASFLALELLEEHLGHPRLSEATEADVRAVRTKCVFTTHTPVPAGHDQFSRALVEQVLGTDRLGVLSATHCCPDSTLNMTFLALRFSHYINGVAMHHGAISQGMFPEYPIRAITNGVHAVRWTSTAFQGLYDRHLPEWRRDNVYLRYAIGISTQEIEAAHQSAKEHLLQEIQTKAGVVLDPRAFTIGFARRAAAYKRLDLLFTDTDRIRRIVAERGKLQIVYAGKAHPRDEPGKEQIRSVFRHGAALRSSQIQVVYLEDYGIQWAKLLTAGVDLWLNTPLRPEEASGTSGMKAAMNGVPSLSVLDGWWIEGCLEGVTGWAIGEADVPASSSDESASLYDKLGSIMSLYYQERHKYSAVMRSAIALNGSFFNTQRMLTQYVANAYTDLSERP